MDSEKTVPTRPRERARADAASPARESEARAPAEPAQAADPDAAADAEPRARHQHWRQLLAGASPREVLARLLNGDPLDVRRAVARRLRERAYLFDADRVHLGAVARCARFALRYRGQPELDAWLADIVDQTLLDLLREEQIGERSNAPTPEDDRSVYADLARPLGLEPTAMRAACAAFNREGEPERRAFYALVIEGRSLDELARENREPATDIARRARRALEAVLVAAQQLQTGRGAGGSDSAAAAPPRKDEHGHRSM
jgi:DNA-directed RNA polymerase specialized sigma24 family protein